MSDITNNERCCRSCQTILLRKVYQNGKVESLVGFARRIYCNFACYNATRSGKREYGRGYYHAQARSLKKETCCERCGSKRLLHVHHRDGNWKNNNVSNLEKLCARCHQRHHAPERALRRYGRVTKKGKTTCLHCDKPAGILNLCSGHHHRHLRYGNPLAPLRRPQAYPKNQTCWLCARKIKGHGFCENHLRKVRRGSITAEQLLGIPSAILKKAMPS